MKSLTSLALSLAAGVSSIFGANAAEKKAISIEPPFWWVGMANDTLQLAVNAGESALNLLTPT